ncbi:MAG: trypsin-like peptidase domain-containing protein [Thiogranum sp.]|nr:trypsin-like peptidase domain-containing protein [Thiogranum sp.]
MNIRDTVSFFLQAATVGIAVAVGIVLFKPEWLDWQSPVVEVHQAPQRAGGSQPALSVGVLPGQPTSYADAIEPAARAVVNIYTAKVVIRQQHPLLDDPLFGHFFGDQLRGSRKRLQTSLGSGVIVSDQGYIMTSNHVIDGADEIQVMLQDERQARATLVGADKDTDLAVLKIEMDDLPVLTLASMDKLRVGDVALAIGNPYGVGQTVTMGIISATGRNQLGINRYEDFIQTDAAINPGNSGGALVNAHGELIGINSAIYSRSGGFQGIGFAIPVALAVEVMTEIIEYGRVDRGWLGIEAQDLTPQLAETFGLDDTRGMLVAGVLRNGPADAAGLQPGDVVVSIDGKAVTDAYSAMFLIGRSRPGSTVLLEGMRNGSAFRAKAISGRPPTG